MSSLLAFAWRQKGSPTPQNGSSTSPYDLPGVTFTFSGENEDTTLDSCRLRCPGTPEGLRPRKSADSIRRALNLPSSVLNPLQGFAKQSDQAKGFSFVPAPIKHTIAGPPPPPPSFWQMRSPPISTSSFYSSSRSPTGSRGVAVSPNLKVGHARTAVGALLAMTDASRGASSPSVPVFHNDNSRHLGVLPPRTWVNDDRQEEHESACSDLSYQALNDSIDPFAPAKKGKSTIPDSPHSSVDESTQHASPSSNNFGRRNHQGEPSLAAQDESSFARGWLMEQGAMGRESYDFDTIVDQDLFVSEAAENAANVSAISGSTKGLESLNSFDEEEEEHYYYQSMQQEEDQMGEPLHRQNTKFQRELKDNLVMAMIARLQDNTRLFQDVLDKLDQSTGQSLKKSPRQREGIVIGFSKMTRTMLCRNIDEILHDMRAGANDDFLLPTQNPRMTEAHDDLLQALAFCRASVVGALTQLEKREMNDRVEGQLGQIPSWKPRPVLNSCLGFEQAPESPDTVRGGDTSLYSLPSDSANTTTPHTSNVSMTTTITSAFSPNRKGRQQDGVRLRRTIEATATLLERLSLACTKLAQLSSTSNEASIKATEEVKRVYLQLLAIKTDDLSALIDSFEVDQPPLQIARLVPEDRNAPMPPLPHRSSTFVPPSHSFIRAPAEAVYSSSLPPVMPRYEDSPQGSETDVIADDQRANFFSPSTADMNSTDNGTYVAEDLRRAQGSFDREDMDFERESAPPEGPARPEFKKRKSGKWHKSRSFFFKSKTAE